MSVSTEGARSVHGWFIIGCGARSVHGMLGVASNTLWLVRHRLKVPEAEGPSPEGPRSASEVP